jgi:hypothetical protein
VGSSRTVDVVKLMRDELDISAEAASALLCHGQVSIDGRTIGMGETRWPQRELTGRMLKAGARQAMMFSSGRPIDQCPIEEVGIEVDLTDPVVAASIQGALF